MISFTALAVLLDFLLQVTAFVALIVLDSLRAEDNRVDCFPCIKVPSLHADPDKGITEILICGETSLFYHFVFFFFKMIVCFPLVICNIYIFG
jgi:hypothetical protein